jgi:hypothetical protein
MRDLNMESFHEYINEYRKQLEKGAIQGAYKGLMEYIMSLRTHLKNIILIISYRVVFIMDIWI